MYEGVLTERLMQVMEGKVNEEEGGFRKGKRKVQRSILNKLRPILNTLDSYA